MAGRRSTKRRPLDRFQFVTRTRTKNADGEHIETDTVLKTIPGMLEELSARERVVGDQVRGIVTHSGLCEYDDRFHTSRDIVKPEMVLITKGRRFNILGVLEVERRRKLKLELEEITV